MPHLVVVGSTNVDLTFRVASLPRPGQTVSARSLTLHHGGKGANQAVMAARLGAAVCFLSAVGDDDFGRQALANLRQQGVDTTHVRIRPESTGTAAICVDDHAQNTIVVVPGANATLSPTDVRPALPFLASAHAVLAQLETPADTTLEAFRIARTSGVRTLFNPAPVGGFPEELLQVTDVLVVNETELEALTGLDTRSPHDVGTAARALLTRGPSTVLVTLGDAGSRLFETDHEAHVPAFPVDAIDTTGAGDAWIGSLAVYLSSGLPMEDAMRRASAVAALAVTRPGAQGSFPSRDEVEAFLLARGLSAGR